MQQVHLRFNDAAGKPVAVRMRVTDAAGNAFAPHGRSTTSPTEADVALADGVWSFLDGSCEILLPPGPLKVSARKGPEYRPLDADVVLTQGKMSLRFTLERWCDLAAEGWHSGDVCSSHISPHAALLEAAANDLAVVDLLVESDLVNIAAYSGQSPALSRPGHMVVVNTANVGPGGRLLLLNTHRTVYPLSFRDGENWSLVDWCDQCHRKKGLVVADGMNFGDDVLRCVDAVMLDAEDLGGWFAALNRGLKLPVVGGSGKRSRSELLGSRRTYAKIDGPLDYASWIEAIRAGRTFATSGPLIKMTDGDSLTVEANGTIDLIANGDVVATGDERLVAPRPTVGWFVARCRSAAGWAITSPIYGLGIS